MALDLSATDLRKVFPHADEEVMASVSQEWNDTLARYGMNDTRTRLLFFMAQTGEETGGWRSMIEGGRFSGDRDRYRGRGLIQLTGRSNYQRIGAKLARDFPDAGLTFDLVNNPDLVATPPYVLKTAGAWWDANGVNAICDTGDFLQVCIKVNGRNPDGFPNGWKQRQAELSRITKVLATLAAVETAAGSSKQTDTPSPALAIGATGPLVTALQTMLKNAGYDLGAVDGKFGTLTRAALLAFQADNNITPTGVADAETYNALGHPVERPLSDQRVSATANEVLKLGSRTVWDGKTTNLVGWIASVLGGLGIMNSGGVAIANSAKSSGAAATQTATQVPSATTGTGGGVFDLTQAIVHLQNLANTKTPIPVASLSTQLQDVIKQLSDLKITDLNSLLTPENAALLQKLKTILAQSGDTTSGAAVLINQLINLQSAAVHAAQPTINTVFDLLPPDTLGALTPVVATVANSVLPGFGGAIATLAIGLATQALGNRAVAARVDDHRTAANVNR